MSAWHETARGTLGGNRRLDTLRGRLHPPAVTNDVELLIAGGGLTGLLLAVTAAEAGLAVAIVDRQDPAAMLGEGFDGRSSAIGYGSRQVLDVIGLWPDIAPNAEPILEIRVVDDDSPLFLHYDHRDLESAVPLGYIVENRVLRQVLVERLRSAPNLLYLAPFTVVSAESLPLAAVCHSGTLLTAV